MGSEEWMWVYLNRFGWFYKEDGQEVEWREAKQLYDSQAIVVYKAPHREAEPKRLGDGVTLEEVEQDCRKNESKWAV